MLSKYLLLLPALLVAQTASALQVLEAVDEGVTHHARISRDEMTRLAIQDGRIVSMHFPDGRLTVEKDEEQGYAVLRARDNDPVSLVVSTSSGQTHSIYLTPTKMGMDTILVKEKEKKAVIQKTQSSAEVRADSQTKSIKRLILAMARDEKELRDFVVEPVDRDIDLWQESHFRAVDKYTGPDVTGYRFVLTNISGKPMRLGEQEFFKRGVIAVAIDRHVLASGEKTSVFVIMVRNNGE